MTDRTDTAQASTAALGELLIFVRAGSFYSVASVIGRDLRQQAEDHAALNHGTLRVEDMHGNVLWRLQ
jgi:hypothetical protein